ncbi:MAG TPA: hypothetical protein VI072_14570 [Polyangiaceae bacterium]
MKRRFQRYAGFLGCLLAFWAASCRPILGLDEETPNRTRDAGPVGPPPRWWIEKDAGCEIEAPPARGDFQETDAGPQSSTDEPIYFALTQLRIGSVDDEYKEYPSGDPSAPWQNIGFDLDGQCESPCEATSVSGCPNVLDGKGCRDNAIGQLIYNAQTVIPDLKEERLNCELLLGGYNVILKVSGYNGKPDDRSVRVDIYPALSVGREDKLDIAPCPSDTRWRNYASRWKSNEHWLVAHDAVTASVEQPAGTFDLPDSIWRSADAFVRGWYLVATFDRAEFWLNGQRNIPGFRIKLSSAVSVGWLAKRQGRWHLSQATLGGRTTVEDMLDSFEELGVTEEQCLGGHRLTKLNLTYSRDLSAETGSCEDPGAALSFGLSFEAEQTLGGRLTDEAPRRGTWPLGELCGDGGAVSADADASQ